VSDEKPLAGGIGASGDAVRKRLRPARPPEEHAARLESGEAWRQLCRDLEAAGEAVLSFPQMDHPELRPEGFRYLLGLVRSGIDQATQLSDPDQPRFVRNPDSQAKWGAENADNQYLWCRVRPDARYRVTGNRRNVFDFLLEVKEGYMQLGDDRVFASAGARDLLFGPDGRFELLLAAERPAGHTGNWMPIHPEARYLCVRQYLVDWEREDPAHFGIARLGGEGVPPAPLTAERMGAILDSAGEWTLQTARFWCEWVDELRRHFSPGRISPPRRFVGGADDIVYGNDWWRLGPDEAMLVEGEVPAARYWQIQLGDVWFRSLDYATRQTSLNHLQAHVDGDGRFRAVVAHRDPGAPNWLDTGGHPEGMFQYRYVWTRDRPQPRARIVPFDEIRAGLPEGHPVVTPEERRRTLAMRQAHLPRREPVT
jgi:hypothetical protein